MATRVLSRWEAYAGAVLLALLANGCALTATVQVTPIVGTPGQPLSYQITITNPASCAATGVEMVFVPLIPRNEEVDQFCSFAQNPSLILCENAAPGDLPPDVLMHCCADPTFAMNNPQDCQSDTFGNEPNLKRDAESILSSHGLQTTATATVVGGSGAAVSCGFDGQVFDCTLDDIPSGQTETVMLTVSPTSSGSFANFVIVGGTLSCLGPDQVPFGSTCSDTQVGGSPAPALSGAGIAAALALLLAIGAWRLRAVRRVRSPRSN